jgi:hypothetical protein
MKDDIICGIFVIFISLFTIIFFAYCIVVPITFIGIAIEPNVEVFVDKELVYEGTNECVNVRSSGDTTTVRISKFYCLMPHKVYTSKDVIVRTVE